MEEMCKPQGIHPHRLKEVQPNILGQRIGNSMSTSVISRIISQAINSTNLVPYFVHHPLMKTSQIIKHLNGAMRTKPKHGTRGETPIRGVGLLSACLADVLVQFGLKHSLARPLVSSKHATTGNLLSIQPPAMAQQNTIQQRGKSGQLEPTLDSHSVGDPQLSAVPPQSSMVHQQSKSHRPLPIMTSMQWTMWQQSFAQGRHWQRRKKINDCHLWSLIQL